MQDKVMSWQLQTFIVAYEQNLSTDYYDLDLWASDMFFFPGHIVLSWKSFVPSYL